MTSDEKVNKLIRYVTHLPGCGGYGSDSLSNIHWLYTGYRWRDCTCGLAEIMLGELYKSGHNE